MWADGTGQLDKAQPHSEKAVGYLPSYVPANLKMAEAERAKGQLKKAQQRLEEIASSLEHPQVFELLGRLYKEGGDRERGQAFIAQALTAYDKMLEGYPRAWAHRAASFLMGDGEDALRAVALAKLNLRTRSDSAALAIWIRASANAKRMEEVCEQKSALKNFEHPHIGWQGAKKILQKKCR